MRRHFYAMLMLVYAASFPTHAASAQKSLNELSGQSYQARTWYPENNGPPAVSSITQTPDGYLWLANEFGLYRCDGMNYINLNQSTDKLFKYQACNYLFLTSDGSLLAGFNSGLILKYKHQQWSQLDSEQVFMHKTITAISEDSDHNLWIGLSGSGVIRYHPKTSRVFTVAEGLCDNNINVICKGTNREVWVGTDNGLCRIVNDQIKSYTQNEGLTHRNINGLWMDSSNTLWIGTADGHLYHLQNGKLAECESSKGIIQSCIRQITGFEQNTIAIGTEGQGIFLLDTKTGTLQEIDTRKGLASNLVLALFKDKEDNLWAGTQTSGLLRIRKVPLQILTTKNGLSLDFEMTMAQSADGSIWVGNSTGGVDRIRDGKVENLGPKLGIVNAPVFAIAIDAKNNIWFGSQGVLVRYDGKTARHFNEKQGLNCTYFRAVYVAKDGRLWVGTDQGIFIMSDDKVSDVITMKDGLPSNKIIRFMEDRKGTMWIGTYDHGLASINNMKIKTFGSKEGISGDMILGLHLDSLDNIWIGTDQHGLFHLNPGSEILTPVATGKLAAEIGKSVGYIFEDKSGYMWIAGNIGLTRVKFSVLQKSLEDKNIHLFCQTIPFDQTTGLSGLTLAMFPGACALKNGQLWYPSGEGIAVIDPQTAFFHGNNPVSLIDSVLINGKPAIKQEEYEVGAGMMHLEIHYAAPSFIRPEKLTYRYRLEGFDRDWDTVGTRHTAYFTNIPPGDYTFDVQVLNNNSESPAGTASIKIHVLPFFYQTWWFIILCIIAGLIVIWLTIKYRIRYIRDKELEALVVVRTEEIRKLNEQLEQKVTDRTAQLEAANKELEAFSYSVSHDLKGPVRRIDSITRAYIEDYFARLDKTEMDFLNKISQSAGSMNMLIDELLKLSRIVRHEIDKMQVNISEIATEINQEIRKLNPGRKVHLVIQEGMLDYCDPKLLRIVFQNLFDNAWKYSGKEKESLIEFGRMEKDGKTVYFIRDNGVGFDMAYYDKLFTPFQRLHSDDQFTGTGIGLATVKRIILKHGGLIWAESSPGAGTTFYFTLDAGF
ncbi:MAG: hypothetical protein D4R97_08225 [Bacteroidetes bacterium]|nr:MAG: hypothetical protein D4R97_08225 [Bacteroidota bacterium]